MQKPFIKTEFNWCQRHILNSTNSHYQYNVKSKDISNETKMNVKKLTLGIVKKIMQATNYNELKKFVHLYKFLVLTPRFVLGESVNVTNMQWEWQDLFDNIKKPTKKNKYIKWEYNEECQLYSLQLYVVQRCQM